MLLDNDKLSWIVKMIREIDIDKNGYITTQELEDILGMVIPDI